MRLTLIAAGLAVLVAGCASVWPAACRSGLSGIECKCSHIAVRILPLPGTVTETVGVPRDRRPGMVSISCDGSVLPVDLRADRVGGPP